MVSCMCLSMCFCCAGIVDLLMLFACACCFTCLIACLVDVLCVLLRAVHTNVCDLFGVFLSDDVVRQFVCLCLCLLLFCLCCVCCVCVFVVLLV